MYIPNYPEDSTLRRHYVSAAAIRLQEFLAMPPSDSTLRRHYEQRIGAQGAAASPLDSTANSANGVGPLSTAETASKGGGLLGWLRRLFG